MKKNYDNYKIDLNDTCNSVLYAKFYKLSVFK